MTPSATSDAVWSAREAQLLAVTLRLLQEHGYERLTVDAVASEARASKATVYRRWPSKAELVFAAFMEGVRAVAVAPHTGCLRGDLLALGRVICEHARLHAPTVRAVLTELSRNPALSDALDESYARDPIWGSPQRDLLWLRGDTVIDMAILTEHSVEIVAVDGTVLSQ